jgi:hypothetical protein
MTNPTTKSSNKAVSTTLLVISLFFSTTAPAQILRSGQAIYNYPTKDYVDAQGTRMQIDLPKDYVPIEKNGIGFRKHNMVMLEIEEDNLSGFPDRNTDSTKQILTRNGYKIDKINNFLLNGYEAQLTEYHNETTHHFLLLFGNYEFTEQLMGYLPRGYKPEADILKKAMISVSYDKNKTVKTPKSLGFDFKDNLNTFQISKISKEGALFLRGSRLEKDKSQKAAICVTEVTADETLTTLNQGLEGIIRTFLKDKNLSIFDESTIVSTTIDGQPAKEVFFYTPEENTNQFNYFAITKKGNTAIIIYGYAMSNTNTRLTEFRDFCKSIKFR